MMKRLSATQARKNFFGLLDSAASGETVLIERKGQVIRLMREKEKVKRKRPPDYRRHLKSPLDHADQWTWDWDPAQGLKPKLRSVRSQRSGH